MEHQTAEQDSSCLPEPLTRHNQAGVVYERLPTVDRQIRDALELDLGGLQRCCEETDEASPNYLKEESLVYLIRYYRKVGNRQYVDDLSTYLVKRCAKSIYSWLGGLEADERDDGYSEVVEKLFTRILDLNSDRGDFLQVRFWVVLERLTVDVFNKKVNQLRYQSTGGYDLERIDTLTQQGAVVVPATSPSRSVESEAINKVLLQEALDQLEEPIRSAYLLRHYAEWPIEDRDPTIRTISRRFDKTPRTIRNWLSKANEILKIWRGEQK
ncbi:MAG: sigma-70 family RNA polymerase sigma factor [Caldilineaceae bacterium SB0665_bin_21]|nr:sigma-70 family RNA polymerase sigma factor [Caldilineaceae bacterium SB0665_bin_21]